MTPPLDHLLLHDAVEASEPLSGDSRFLGRYIVGVRARFEHAALQEALSRAQEDGDRLRRARLLRILGDNKEAAKELKILVEGGNNAWARAYLAELELVREPQRAAEELGRAMAANPEAAPPRLWRGYAHFLLEDWDAAATDWGAAASLDGAGVAARLLLGILRERRDEPERALEALDAAAALDPACPGLFTLRAGVLARLERWSEGISDAHRAIALHPENLDGFLRVLFRMEHLGRPDPATEKAMLVEVLARKTREQPEAAWLFALKAEAEKRAGFFRHEQSTADLERAVALEPSRAWLRAFLGRALTSFHRTGELAQRGLEQLEEACRLDPKSGWMRAWKAEILKNMGRDDEALADLDAAAALDPDYRLARSWRGELRLRRGDAAGADADFTSALEIREDNSWTLHQRAVARRALGKTAAALADMKKAVDSHPKYILLHLGLKDASARSVLGHVVRALRGQTAKGSGDPAPEESAIDRIVRDVWGDSLERSVQDGAQDGAAGGAGKGSFEQLLQFEAWTAEALSEFMDACARDPLGPLWRGRVRLNAGDASGALSDIERSLAVSRSALAELWRGEALLVLGREQEADLAFTRALECGGTCASPAAAWRAGLRAKRGEGADCLEDLLLASRRDPTQSKLYQSWGRLLTELFGEGFSAAQRQRCLEAAAELALRADDLPAARAALRDGAGSARGSVLRGLLLAQAAEQGADAELERAVAADPREAASLLESLKAELIHLREDSLLLVWAALAKAYTALRDWGAALEACRRYLELRPLDARGHRLRAAARRGAGDFHGSLEDLDALVRLEPSARAFAERGEAKRRTFDLAGSAEDAACAVAMEPGLAEGWLLLAESRRGLGAVAVAVEAAGRAVGLQARSAWPLVVRAKAWRAGSLPDEALLDVDAALALEPDSAKAHGWRGEILRKLGRTAEALAALDRAIALDPEAAWFFAVRAEAKRELGDLPGCLDDLARAVMDPRCSAAYDFLGTEPQPARSDAALAWVHGLLGGARRRDGDLAAAVASFDQALALDAGCFWARAWRGETRLRQGELAGAEADLNVALGAHPGYVDAQVWLGEALLEQKRYQDAVESYGRALAGDGSRVLAYVGRGLAQKELGRFSDSVADFEKARVLAPELFEEEAAAGRPA